MSENRCEARSHSTTANVDMVVNIRSWRLEAMAVYRSLAPVAGGLRIARYLSVDRQCYLAGEAGKRCYSRSWRSPGEVLADFDTRLDTPPISLRHHPFSRIAPGDRLAPSNRATRRRRAILERLSACHSLHSSHSTNCLKSPCRGMWAQSCLSNAKAA
jgi:hypothetical protein